MKPIELVEIPRDRWRQVLPEFGRRHQGWLASLEVHGHGAEPCTEVHELPLSALNTLMDGSGEILITLGEAACAGLSHRIPAPVCVRLGETLEPACGLLEIESCSGAKSVLCLHSAVLPGALEERLAGAAAIH